MLGISAQSLMIAARAENKVYMRDAKHLDEKHRKDRYFWQGRKWRAIDPNKL
ncbi:MAG: hypothetical protein WBA92_13730 [Pseudorhodobacter sp.]